MADEKTYTQEEVDSIVDEANTRISDMETRLDEFEGTKNEKSKLEADLTTANEELEKFKNKEFNFNQLRKTKEQVNGENEEIKTKLNETDKKLEIIMEQNRKDVIDDFKESQGLKSDKELEKKFDYYFDKLGKEAKTKQELKVAAEEASSLATKDIRKSVNAVVSRQASWKHRTINDDNESEVSKEMRKDMGISDEDRKKYKKGTPIPIV